mmetsp:Transcript_36891/g.91796  ORF Transcript_36891/g.91796 Transcript_36891/m.91796 type:complete len:270 (-) Transcript_36891:360-1169(-)
MSTATLMASSLAAAGASAAASRTRASVAIPSQRSVAGVSLRAPAARVNKISASRLVVTRAAADTEKASTSVAKPFEGIMEAKTSFPVSDNRSESFARTSHFSKSCEQAINEQINIEYNISYIYHAMYAYFARDNVYLPGLAKHFQHESGEEREHAELLMNYQIMRGGRVELQAIMPPQVDFDHPEKGDALYAFELSLSLEKLNNDRLLILHGVADEANDANMMDFIEGELLMDQVKSVQKVAEYVSALRRMGSKGDAVWHFDQMMLNKD